MKASCLFVLLASMFLSSCSLLGGRGIIHDSSDKTASKRFEQILSALENNEPETLRAMFSRKALDEATDFESQIEYLFTMFQGTVQSCEQDRFGSSEDIREGKRSVKLRSWYTVSTDVDVYMFMVIDFTVDTINTDNEGLYTIRAIKAADEETQFAGYWEDMELPGIYNPEEESLGGIQE